MKELLGQRPGPGEELGALVRGSSESDDVYSHQGQGFRARF